MVDDLRNNAYGLYGKYQNFANSTRRQHLGHG